MQSRGSVAKKPCKKCANNKGPFLECVVVPGANACAGCWYNCQARNCSLRRLA
ncbi:hypothetical protein QBC41DRAFT_314866 [Cercophora samala]|uniref:Uncharacterized protein n=1 Tax=Cercophora samala TaxID=330535 RepID=A0AA39ZJ23_9PEZI|nr:hypothetical protein QBC41DRAFT_314866 [Cercophora samala]